MVMLEKMRRFWNTYPRKKFDINSWSPIIDILVSKIATSSEARNSFVNKYGNILCLQRIYSIAEKNRRWQARAWLDQQDKKYILVKDSFKVLGYPSIEEECDRCGGFVTDDNANMLQEQCFAVLEDVCREVFPGFFPFQSIPGRKIITNSRAVYHGMAITHKRRHPLPNVSGILIRYDISELYLKSEIFNATGYYDALSTYVHEMCHMFGGDTSASFSQALTFALELLMRHQETVKHGNRKWEQLFETDFDIAKAS